MSMQAHEKRDPSRIMVLLGSGTILLVNVLTTKPSLMIPKTSDLPSIHLSSAISEKRREKKSTHSMPSMKIALRPTFSLRLICSARMQG